MTRELAVTIDDLERIEEKKVTKQEKAKEANTTKHLAIHSNEFCHHFVKWEGGQGGAMVPSVLKGLWISKTKLQDAIALYMKQRG